MLFRSAKQVYQPAIYLEAAKALLEQGKIDKQDVPWDTDGYKAPTTDFIDHMEYDGKKPLEYINNFAIGEKDPKGPS